MPTKEELEKLSKAVAKGKVPQIKGLGGVTEKLASIIGSGAGGTAPTTATPDNNPDVPYLSETEDGVSKTPAVTMPAGDSSSSNSENPDAAIAKFADVSSNNMLDALTSPEPSQKVRDAAISLAGSGVPKNIDLTNSPVDGVVTTGASLASIASPEKYEDEAAGNFAGGNVGSLSSIQKPVATPEKIDYTNAPVMGPIYEPQADETPKSYVVQPEEAPTFDPTKLEGDRSPRAMALAQMGFNMNKLRLEREARTAGRKDFAAALDAAGYDPSTASAKDKATFYAQGKELGLSSKQIDKYALDRAEKIAKQKDRIKNPDKYRQPSPTAAAAAAQVAGGEMRRMPMELPPISQAGPYRPPQTQAGPARPYQARNYYPPS